MRLAQTNFTLLTSPVVAKALLILHQSIITTTAATNKVCLWQIKAAFMKINLSCVTQWEVDPYRSNLCLLNYWTGV